MWVSRREGEARERLERTVERVLLRLGKLTEAQCAQLLQLVGREVRREQHLRQELEDEGQVTREAAPRAEDLEGVEAVRGDDRARCRGPREARDLEPGVPGGTALEHVGHQRGRAPLLGPDQPVAGEQGAVEVDGGVAVAGQQQDAAPSRQSRLPDERGQLRVVEAGSGADSPAARAAARRPPHRARLSG